MYSAAHIRRACAIILCTASASNQAITLVSCDESSSVNQSNSVKYLDLGHNYPSKDKFFVRDKHADNLSILFDSRTRNPKWVMEHLRAEESTISKSDRKKSKFFSENSIDIESFRVC